MVLLEVDLQDGFKDDTVIINVNNKQAFHKDNVNTKLMIGYADSFKLDVPAGSVTIKIVLSSRGLSKTCSFNISEQVFVALSLQDDHVNCQTSKKPFVYF
jgi:hypothetical protein